MAKFVLGLCAVLALTAGSVSADVIAFEDFDGGAVNLSGTTNVENYDAAYAGDVFNRVSPFYLGGTGMPFDVADDTVADVSGGGQFPTDTLGLAGQMTTAFFALNDMDGSGLPGYTFANWQFDISSAIELDGIEMDIAALGDFEASSSDGFLVEVQIDAGGFMEIFRGECDEAAFKTYRPFDNGFIFEDDDPLALYIDGAASPVGFLDKSDPTTGDFDTYLSTLIAGQTGSTLDIRVSWSGTPSGSEPMGLDNFTVMGRVPEPASLALLSLGAVALLGKRRDG
jgi:hypothetical protein